NVFRSGAPATGFPDVEQAAVGFGRKDPICFFGGDLRRAWSAYGDQNPGRVGGKIVHASALQLEVAAKVRLRATLPEQASDVDGFRQHLMPDRTRRPSGPNHMLVEPLACTKAEREALAADDRNGRGRLRDDRRMVAKDGAGDRGDNSDPAGLRCDRAQHAPGEW